MRFFTVIDALKGYHQVSLDNESAAITTLSTPFGRYMYRRLSFGICHADDDYSRHVSAVFDNIPNFRRIIGDILIFSDTRGTHFSRPKSVPARCRQPNRHQHKEDQIYAAVRSVWRLYPEKHRIPAQPGTLISHQSVFYPHQHHGDESNPRSVPVDGQFLQQFSGSTRSPYPLLKNNFHWEWTKQLEAAFNAVRLELSSSTEQSFYDQALFTALNVDFSRLRGLGFILRQQDPNENWNVVQVGSCFLSDADNAGVPGRSLSHSEVPAVFGRPPIIPSPHGSSASHPDPKRLQLRQTRQPANSTPAPENAALSIHCPLDPLKEEFNG
jgi:hypothetical protein